MFYKQQFQIIFFVWVLCYFDSNVIEILFPVVQLTVNHIGLDNGLVPKATSRYLNQ